MTIIAKSDDKFVTHNMKWGNIDQISTRLCRPISALYYFICKYKKNVLGCVYQYVTSVCDVYVVVQIFPWFKIFQTSLIFTFLCLKAITIIRDKEKQKLNWFEKF